MVSVHEFRVTVPEDRARHLVTRALEDQGLLVQQTQGGSLTVSDQSAQPDTTNTASGLSDRAVRFEINTAASATGTVIRTETESSTDATDEVLRRLDDQLAVQGVLDTGAPNQDTAAYLGSAYPSASSTTAPGGHTNTVSIVALILGFVVPLGGIIAGAIALAQIKRTGEKGRGLALAGIIIGSALIVLGIIAGILFFVIGITAAQTASSGLGAPSSPSVTSPTTEPSPSADDPESVDVFSLSVGDCLNDSGADEVTNVDVIDCAAAHDLEVFTDFPLAGDTYPGEDQVDALANDGCLQAFPAFVGLGYNDSALDYTYFVPTQQSWENGNDRLVSCLIGEPNTQTQGSLAGAAR